MRLNLCIYRETITTVKAANVSLPPQCFLGGPLHSPPPSLSAGKHRLLSVPADYGSWVSLKVHKQKFALK